MSEASYFKTSVPYARHGLGVRLCYLLVALGWRLLTVFGVFGSKDTVVLCYHGVRRSQRERFRRQMADIAGRAMSHAASGDRLRKGARRTPDVRVTFDDAFANLLKNALPALEEHQIPGTIFAVADNLGSQPRWAMPMGHPEAGEETMTVEQLVGVSKTSLIRIGSHTLSHPNLVKIPASQVSRELMESKRKLEELLGCPVKELALPHGAYDQEVLTLAAASGYERVYTLDPRPANLESGELCVGRFSMSPDVWRIEFRLTCAGAYAWLASWRRLVSRLRRVMARN